MTTFFDFKVPGLEGGDDLLGPLRGKVVLAVNVASKCGLTPQYAGLEKLHEELADQGFSVVGFPCNQFGGQEPGSAQDIRSFCTATYGVTFPLSAKIEVNGPNRHPLYAWLIAAPVGSGGDIQWNFEKFLIGRDGQVRRRYPPTTKPQDKGLLQDIADTL
ncbi:MAG: glutathione peroxidase [Steroidobacteraceae bacterium]|nr:glutathione peroxidase [Steroidobacteraceae bacterium]MDW8259007.1 glutathione peroxidase [Gammaproteobacteria bacterium]